MPEAIYDPQQIEARWQEWWRQNGTHEVDLQGAENPYYVLMMFPYPSAEGLHVGNVYAFTGADIQGRFQRLRGYDVFEPIGFDAFGIHSENFAMKIGRHPRELIPSNVKNFTRQLNMMGFMYDWRYVVDTTTPEYYKWTQWVFLQLYKAGFVYRDTKEVNFCPDCGTVISDEQVNPDGTCERHTDTPVERRMMPCWFFKITAFADKLLDNHDWLDWSAVTKTSQINWIGRSKGAEVTFKVNGRDEEITVFTTRPDTLFGATFMVLAPEHPLVDKICAREQMQEILEYRVRCSHMTEEERKVARDKTGVHIGAHAINPVNGEKIPIFIADYVMMGYGTGAIMAVPSGDHRDFAFAEKFNLDVRPIIDPDMTGATADQISAMLPPMADIPSDTGTFTMTESFYAPPGDDLLKDYLNHGQSGELRQYILRGDAAWSGPGAMINSANDEISLDGLAKEDAIARITEWLVSKGLGKAKSQFKLRDWGISRQRYWGPPVPVIYDEDGNIHPVPEDQLPVELPDIDDFRPKGDGKGPLANEPQWVETTLPDGRPGRRETDVMDNFLDSAWYFLRYISANDPDRPWDPELIKKWLPVDFYIGGNEHANLHLMYTRFICLALTEAGVLDMGGTKKGDLADIGEPFRRFRAHGLITKDGRKMSKKWGNVVNPDDIVASYGADTLRMYLMFLGPYEQGGDWRDENVMGIRRFLNRLYTWYFEPGESDTLVPEADLPAALRTKLHQTIKKVGADMGDLGYNTAIASLMELHNALKAEKATSDSARRALCIMLAPFAPHLAEEIWQKALGQTGSVFDASWPEFDEALTVEAEVEIPLQINGKVRDRFTVPRDADQATLEAAARESDAVKKALAANGAQIRKVIVVPGRLVNLIIK
ncbi:MAG: leucine--tRNA ligase [Sumerlaeia bacterium]